MMKVEGQQVEAPKATREVGLGRGVTLPNGEGSGDLGRGLCASHIGFCLIFCLGVLNFGCSLMHFLT